MIAGEPYYPVEVLNHPALPWRHCLKKQAFLLGVMFLSMASLPPSARAQNEIPKAAWRRPIGLSLENPGVRRNTTDIDDGYWQGAPVRLRFRNFFANLPWRLCTLAHQSWRSQIRGQLRKRVRHVPTI